MLIFPLTSCCTGVIIKNVETARKYKVISKNNERVSELSCRRKYIWK